MADSTQTDDPTNAGAANTGDTNTAVLEKLAGAVQPSGSEPDSTTPPASTADKTGQPEGDVTTPDDTGKLSRVEQQLAQSNQLLTSLGIDPESEIAERFQKGLITKDELLLRVGVQPTPSPAKTEPVLPPASAVGRLDKLKQRLGDSVKQNKGIMESDILETLDVMSDIVSESAQVQQDANMVKMVADCTNATLAVIEKDPMHADLPDEIKEIESQMFLGATDNMVGAVAKGDSRYYTPNNYAFYGQKTLERRNTLRNHWIEQGKKLQQQAVAGGGKPPVNPISPTTGSAPITPPETPTNIDNLQERAREYVKSQGVV